MIFEMKLFLFVILTAIALIHSQTFTRSNSPEFDWTSFLNISPEHSHIQAANIPQRGSKREEEEEQQEYNNEKKSLRPLTKNQRHYRNWKAKHETLPALIKEQKDAKTKEKHRTFREKIKNKTGFSSKLNAKKAQLRLLEKSGKASSEQIEFLLNEKRKKRQQYHKKMNEKRVAADFVKGKRGRPKTKEEST